MEHLLCFPLKAFPLQTRGHNIHDFWKRTSLTKGHLSRLHQSSGKQARSSSDKLWLRMMESVALTFAFVHICTAFTDNEPTSVHIRFNAAHPLLLVLLPTFYLQRFLGVLEQVFNEYLATACREMLFVACRATAHLHLFSKSPSSQMHLLNQLFSTAHIGSSWCSFSSYDYLIPSPSLRVKRKYRASHTNATVQKSLTQKLDPVFFSVNTSDSLKI